MLGLNMKISTPQPNVIHYILEEKALNSYYNNKEQAMCLRVFIKTVILQSKEEGH